MVTLTLGSLAGRGLLDVLLLTACVTVTRQLKILSNPSFFLCRIVMVIAKLGILMEVLFFVNTILFFQSLMFKI